MTPRSGSRESSPGRLKSVCSGCLSLFIEIEVQVFASLPRAHGILESAERVTLRGVWCGKQKRFRKALLTSKLSPSSLERYVFSSFRGFKANVTPLKLTVGVTLGGCVVQNGVRTTPYPSINRGGLTTKFSPAAYKKRLIISVRVHEHIFNFHTFSLHPLHRGPPPH